MGEQELCFMSTKLLLQRPWDQARFDHVRISAQCDHSLTLVAPIERSSRRQPAMLLDGIQCARTDRSAWEQGSLDVKGSKTL